MNLKKMSYVAALLAVSLGIVGHSMAEAKTSAKSPLKIAAVIAQADETAIRKQITTFTDSLAQGDAEPVANLWTKDGVYIGTDGNVIRGRTEIQKRFAAVFESAGKQFYEITPQNISVLSTNVVQADGTVSRKNGAKTLPETRYMMTFVKENGAWLISSAVETPILSADFLSRGTLEDLAWLVGEWKAEHAGASVKMKAEWTQQKNFIHCTYEVTQPNKPTRTDEQIIGWDPLKNQVVSWFFDATGGTNHGTWFLRNNKWIIESVGMERDGSMSSSLNIIDPTDPSSFLWQSRNRSIDGVALGDTLPLKIERVQ